MGAGAAVQHDDRGALPMRRSKSSTPRTCAVDSTGRGVNRQSSTAERVGHLPHLGLFLGGERIGLVAVDVDLAEDRGAAADEHHQLGPGPGVAGEVVLDGADVGHVLVLAGRHRGAADALADRDPGVVGLAAGERLEHQLVAVQHVEIDRGVGRAGRADLLRGGAEQLLPGPPPARTRPAAPRPPCRRRAPASLSLPGCRAWPGPW